MHPLIARYLSADAARETLQKEKAGAPLSPEEADFVAAASAHPRQRAELLGVSGRALSSDVQASLVLLSAHAAVRALARDEGLAEAVTQARKSLTEEGASEEETEAFLASILLEEAFGEEQEVDTFDGAAVKETLAEVPALAALTREGVDALSLKFIDGGTTDEERKSRAQVAKALFDLAWAEGPAPINPEHMEAFIDAELTDLPEQEQDRRVVATLDLLQLLAQQGILGPLRLARLRAQLGEDD
ncbi:hypothetical protein P2318_08940 [Myxococcaceae bacterium GXIMD 01537]